MRAHPRPAILLALLLPMACTCAATLDADAVRGDGPTLQADQWPQWRGPEGQGISRTTSLPLTWSDTENIRWKTAIPGRGHSSPVIANHRLWITTADETPAKPEDIERRKKSNTGDQPLTVLDEVVLRALCLDTAGGRILHNIELIREREPQWVHTQNSYASPTPVLDNDRLYAHFGTFGTACIDTTTGRVLWTQRDIRLMHENGPGSSPVVWKDLVIFHCDGSDTQSIAALDKATGRIAWRRERSGAMNSHPQLRKAYGTPIVATFTGGTQLISPAADWLYAYDPATGEELWKLPYGVLGFSIVPRPVLGHGMIYLSTSFMRSELLAVRYDGTKPPEIAWRCKRGVPQTPSPILVGDEIYFITDSGGMLTCLDAHTGEQVYQERVGGNFSASPTYAAGRLFFHDREGVTTVIRAGRRFEILARNRLDGAIQASAAIAEGDLFLRTEKSVYRIGRANPILANPAAP